MSKADKFKLEYDGWYDDSSEFYDPGYNAIELWEFVGDRWVCVWESSSVDGDDMNGSAIIKAELIKALPEFGLTSEDIEDIDSDCIHDWEIR